jgi:hypothetical protein
MTIGAKREKNQGKERRRGGRVTPRIEKRTCRHCDEAGMPESGPRCSRLPLRWLDDRAADGAFAGDAQQMRAGQKCEWAAVHGRRLFRGSFFGCFFLKVRSRRRRDYEHKRHKGETGRDHNKWADTKEGNDDPRAQEDAHGRCRYCASCASRSFHSVRSTEYSTVVRYIRTHTGGS